MIDIYLDQHTNSCKNSYYGECKSICYLLIFIKNKYVLVRYHDCENYFGHLDYKQDLIKRIIADNKIFSLYEVEREKYSYNDFCIHAKLNLPLKKSAKQVNYIYSDNAGRQYAITTKTDFFDEIFSQYERNIAFIDAKEYLQKMALDELLLNDLRRLHQANSINSIDDIVIVKTIDNLLKSIHQQIK